jgi:hypothetical protein
MKIYLFLFAFLILTNKTFGQNFNLSELIMINNYSIDRFDTYMTEKGYKYFIIENDKRRKSIGYVFYINGKESYYMTKFYDYTDSPKLRLSFQTMSSSVYLKIKSDLKTLGFKFRDTETNESTNFLNYIKNNIEISLASSINSGNKLTTYEITVTKYE